MDIHTVHHLFRHLTRPYHTTTPPDTHPTQTPMVSLYSHSMWYLTYYWSIQGLYKGVGLTIGLYKEDQWIRRLVQLDSRYASTET